MGPISRAGRTSRLACSGPSPLGVLQPPLGRRRAQPFCDTAGVDLGEQPQTQGMHPRGGPIRQLRLLDQLVIRQPPRLGVGQPIQQPVDVVQHRRQVGVRFEDQRLRHTPDFSRHHRHYRAGFCLSTTEIQTVTKPWPAAAQISAQVNGQMRKLGYEGCGARG